MVHSGKKDPKLSEVKSVLLRLQGFTEDDDFVVTQPARRVPRSADKAASSRGTNLAVMGAIVALAAGVAGAALFVAFSQNEPPAVDSAEPTAKRVKAALEVARGLIAEGKVRAARMRLMTLAEQGSPDAAWDMAQSYNPNVLAKVPKPDAPADLKEAERWYRAWYDAAVKEGLVEESVPLERIIRSMQK